MPTPKKILTADEQLDALLSVLLRTGVTAAAILVLAGGLIYLFGHGSGLPQYHVFRGEPSDYRQVHLILREAVAFRGRAIIQLGLLLLVLTPIGRVAFSAVAFARQRDRIFVAMTLLVLGVLIYNLVH